MAGGNRWLRVALAVVLLPMAVSCVALVVRGAVHLPVGDRALTELQIRDVGHHAVLRGLYSRADWAHPGPLLFYLAAPIYRAVGSAAVAVNLVAVAINTGAMAGMVLIARRRGGVPLAVATLAALSLLVRALGIDFLGDPWNTYVSVLPFGLMLLLTWSMLCGDAWALPIGVFVASFLAQTHVGFVALALPLLGLGAVWLVVGAWRGAGDRRDRVALARLLAGSVALAAVLWSPVIYEVVTRAPNNLSRTIGWFEEADGGTHSVLEGWRVLGAQLSSAPEWITGARALNWATGEPTAIYRSPVPWLLVLFVGAAWAFRRARSGDGVRLVAVVGVAFVLGVAGVARTVGPAFGYRLLWTWTIGAVAMVPILWAAWTLATHSRAGRRALTVGAVAVICTCSAMNTVAAARGTTPMLPDSVVLAELAPAVLAEVEGIDGQVLVDDGPYDIASEYSRGLVLELERHGFDARMTSGEKLLIGDHRVVDGPVATRVIVAQNGEIDVRDLDAGLRRVAEWSSVTEEHRRVVAEMQVRIDQAAREGRLGAVEALYAHTRIDLGNYDDAVAWAVAVYVER